MMNAAMLLHNYSILIPKSGNFMFIEINSLQLLGNKYLKVKLKLKYFVNDKSVN